MQIESVKMYSLADGSYVKAQTYERTVDRDGEETELKSVDISLVKADGYEELLCCIDYNSKVGLTTSVYDEDKPDAVYSLVRRIDDGQV